MLKWELLDCLNGYHKGEYMSEINIYIKQNENYINRIAFILFFIFTFFVGNNHEPWADEAQSWLIARDVPINELFSVMAYEGSPILWPLILKPFIFCGLNYQYLFVVPIIFSSTGVWLLLYKSNLPIWIRSLLPFTYYIFYQYTIVARSYCLVLPILELIALFYNDRLKKTYIYGLLLILLSGISVHMLLLSIVLYLLYCFEVIIELVKKKKDKPCLNNYLVTLLIIGVSYLITIMYLRTPSDHSYTVAKFNLDIINIILNFFIRFGQTLIFNNVTLNEFYISFLLMVIFIFLINCYNIHIKFIIISTTIYLFLICFFCNKWHIGLIFLSMVFAFQIHPPRPKQKSLFVYKYINVFIGIILSIQISWSVRTSFYDYTSTYSGAYSVAKFIKENKYKEEDIYGLGYFVTAIEPYFENNIFKNKRSNKAYYIWSFNNGDLNNEEIISNLPPVVVYSEFGQRKFESIINALKDCNYKCYTFKGASYIKDSIYESQTYYVYVRD